MLMGEGIKDKKDGWTRKNTLALYMYIQFAQDHAIAQTFIGKCRNWKP
jgi:cobyrinic acid a,c-diamide synthase